MKRVTVFIVQGYELALDTGELRDTVTLELIDTDCDSALKRAKKIIKKKFYRISTIIEKEA